MRKILVTGGNGLVGSQFKKGEFSSYYNYKPSCKYRRFQVYWLRKLEYYHSKPLAALISFTSRGEANLLPLLWTITPNSLFAGLNTPVGNNGTNSPVIF